MKKLTPMERLNIIKQKATEQKKQNQKQICVPTQQYISKQEQRYLATQA